MSSRERFEAWHEEYLKKDIQLHTKWDVWQARDAEVARLVEALRRLDGILSGKEDEDQGAAYDRAQRFIDALLREYDTGGQRARLGASED